MDKPYLNNWKRYLNNTSLNEADIKMPKALTSQEKVKIIGMALQLYNEGKLQNLDSGLKTELEAIKTKYPIAQRPDYAANVFDVYVEQNPLFMFINANNM